MKDVSEGFMAKIILPAFGSFIVLASICAIASAEPQGAPSKDDIINALASKNTSTSRGFVQVPASANAPAAKPNAAVHTSYSAAEPAKASAGGHASIGVPILFDVNSATIKPDSLSTLNNIAAALRSPDLTNAKILLEGHTDASGRPEANLELSEQRADAVRDFLVNQGGVPADRLSAVGKGQTEPANPANPMASENRRVVLVNLNN